MDDRERSVMQAFLGLQCSAGEAVKPAVTCSEYLPG